MTAYANPSSPGLEQTTGSSISEAAERLVVSIVKSIIVKLRVAKTSHSTFASKPSSLESPAEDKPIRILAVRS